MIKEHPLKKTRVVIADDSPTAIDIIESICRTDRDIEVVGRAVNGQEVIRLAETVKPDLITMDIHMPVMNGLDAIRHIMAYQPTPILVITSHTDANTAFQSLSIGALDVMDKPQLECQDVRKHEELLRKIKLLAQVKVVTHMSGRRAVRTGARPSRDFQKVVGVVASTGGPRALADILGSLNRPLDAPVLVVQHLADGFSDGLVEWLNGISPMRVVSAVHGDTITPGTVHIAPTGRHMEIDAQFRIVLADREPYLGQKPSGNLLLHALAKNAGRKAVGVVLTGMGNDGAEGLHAVADAGGITMVQDELSSIIYGMPRAALDLDARHRILPLDRMADEFTTVCSPSGVSGLV